MADINTQIPYLRRVSTLPEVLNAESISLNDVLILVQGNTTKVTSVELLLRRVLDLIKAKSAYDIAVDNGFTGTEQEWLESLAANGIDSNELGCVVGNYFIAEGNMKYNNSQPTEFKRTGENAALPIPEGTTVIYKDIVTGKVYTKNPITDGFKEWDGCIPLANYINEIIGSDNIPTYAFPGVSSFTALESTDETETRYIGIAGCRIEPGDYIYTVLAKDDADNFNNIWYSVDHFINDNDPDGYDMADVTSTQMYTSTSQPSNVECIILFGRARSGADANGTFAFVRAYNNMTTYSYNSEPDSSNFANVNGKAIAPIVETTTSNDPNYDSKVLIRYGRYFGSYSDAQTAVSTSNTLSSFNISSVGTSTDSVTIRPRIFYGYVYGIRLNTIGFDYVIGGNNDEIPYKFYLNSAILFANNEMVNTILGNISNSQVTISKINLAGITDIGDSSHHPFAIETPKTGEILRIQYLDAPYGKLMYWTGSALVPFTGIIDYLKFRTSNLDSIKAETAKQLSTTRYIGIETGIEGDRLSNITSAVFDGSRDANITITKLNAGVLTGSAPIDITGNASTADKLNHNITLQLTGGASGSVSFDGSTNNVSLNVTSISSSTGSVGTADKLRNKRVISVDLSHDTDNKNVEYGYTAEAQFDGTANAILELTVIPGALVKGTVDMAAIASKLETKRTINVLSANNGGMVLSDPNNPCKFDGSADAAIVLKKVDASLLTGTVPSTVTFAGDVGGSVTVQTAVVSSGSKFYFVGMQDAPTSAATKQKAMYSDPSIYTDRKGNLTTTTVRATTSSSNVPTDWMPTTSQKKSGFYARNISLGTETLTSGSTTVIDATYGGNGSLYIYYN